VSLRWWVGDSRVLAVSGGRYWVRVRRAPLRVGLRWHVASDTELLNGQVTPDLPALLVDVKNLF